MTADIEQPQADKRGRCLAMVRALGSQLRRAASGPAVPPAAVAELGDRWTSEPMIKPSTHQQVAIDAHRDDRP